MSVFREMMEKMSEGTRTFVCPCGSASGEVFICGEQPGRQEVLMKVPFIGPSGRLLKALLQQAEVPSAACYFTNVLKDYDERLEAYCQAPKVSRASPKWSERGTRYLDLLEQEIKEHPATLLIAAGNVALCALTGRWGINKWRGSLIPCRYDQNKYVVPIIHPSAALRGDSKAKYLILNDLKKAVLYKRQNFKLSERQTLIRPSYNEALLFLNTCKEAGLRGKTITFDIEIKNLEMSCISFCWEPSISMSIPFIYERGDYFTPIQEMEVMKRINEILSSPSIKKSGQNLIFDTHFLLRKYGIRTVSLDDTMIAQHTLMPQLPKGLDMITSLWTDQPYYKDDGKEWFRVGGRYKTLWKYNCLDSSTCSEALPKILDQLSRMDNLLAYERQVSLIEPCCYMTERGIRADIKGLEQEREKIKLEAKHNREKLDSLVPGLNPQSSTQLKNYFYKELGLPAYKNRKREATTDVDALKRIVRNRREGSEEAELILEIKRLENLAQTYMDESIFDPDGRIRCSYNPCGTSYSKIRSSKSIFGTGLNMQNCPQRILRHLKPDEGYVYYNVDLPQAENRIVAYIGRVELMIKAYETGKDLHRQTAAFLLNKPFDAITDTPGSCSFGTGKHSEREWGKRANHTFNYVSGYKTFALEYEIPEILAKRLYNSYCTAYPEVKKNYHKHINLSLQTNMTLTNLMGRKTVFLADSISSSPKEIYSCIPQSTVGDIINERGIAYIYYSKLFKPVELLHQENDSIGFQIPLDVSWDEHARMLWAIKESLERPLTTHYGRSFSLPADFTIGLSLAKEEGITIPSINWPSTTNHLALVLKQSYEELKEKAA